MFDRRKVIIILGAGVGHLKKAFEELGYRNVFNSKLNYDGKRKFPNSDVYTALTEEEIESIGGKHVIIVQGANYMETKADEQWTTADLYFETLQYLHLLNNPQRVREIGHKEFEYTALEKPKQIDLVFTCMPCGKQDHAVQSGEAVSSQMVLEFVAKHVSTIYLVDPHPPMEFEFMERLKTQGKLKKISLIDKIKDKMYSKFEVSNPVEVTADEFGKLRMNMNSLGKIREDSSTVRATGKMEVTNKDVVFVDDMMLTGGTLRSNVKKYREMGARKVVIGIIHPLPLVDVNDKRLKQTLEEIQQFIVSNTIYSSFIDTMKERDQLVDCVPVIDEKLHECNN